MFKQDLLLYVQQALVSKEMSFEEYISSFFYWLLIAEAHSLSSGAMFIGRILYRIMQQKKNSQARKQYLLLVQHTIYRWFEPKHFICSINEILKLNIP